MRKTIIIYGLALAVLCTLLKLLEFNYLIQQFSIEVYIGTVAVLFTVLGIWIGNQIILWKHKKKSIAVPGITPKPEMLEKTQISPREFEVLQLIAAGYSNQEIASRLFVSLNTIKTHSSNLFVKLDVKRRTQAVQKAKELQLIT